MAKAKYYVLRGKLAWTQNLFKLDESPYGKTWNVELYPDADSLALFKEAGIQLQPNKKPVFEGELGYKFKRYPERNGFEFDPPVVVDNDGEEWDSNVAIGNGSIGEVTVCVYPTRKGMGPNGSRLEAVRVLEHVPYERPIIVPGGMRRVEDAQPQQNNAVNGTAVKTNVNSPRTPKTPW